jgi:hypothetical protein
MRVMAYRPCESTSRLHQSKQSGSMAWARICSDGVFYAISSIPDEHEAAFVHSTHASKTELAKQRKIQREQPVVYGRVTEMHMQHGSTHFVCASCGNKTGSRRGGDKNKVVDTGDTSTTRTSRLYARECCCCPGLRGLCRCPSVLPVRDLPLNVAPDLLRSPSAGDECRELSAPYTLDTWQPCTYNSTCQHERRCLCMHATA